MEEGRKWVRTRVISRRDCIVEEREIGHYHNKIIFPEGRALHCTDRMIETYGQSGEFDDTHGGVSAAGAFMGDWDAVAIGVISGAATLERGEFTLRGEPIEVDYS